jgi:hypothetical protein
MRRVGLPRVFILIVGWLVDEVVVEDVPNSYLG